MEDLQGEVNLLKRYMRSFSCPIDPVYDSSMWHSHEYEYKTDAKTYIDICRKNESQAKDLKKVIREKMSFQKELEVWFFLCFVSITIHAYDV